MMVTVLSCALSGLDPSLIQVETDLSNGLPKCMVVGLPDSTINEAKDRVRSAIKNSGFDFPTRRLTINLAPADLPKEGSGFDLPMAIGILAVSGQIPVESLKDYLFIGELGLDGSVRPVSGLLAMAAMAAERGPNRVIVPAANMKEALIFDNLHVWPVKSIVDAVAVLHGLVAPSDEKVSWIADDHWPHDFAEVKGQPHAKRSLEIAAAGNHNVLMIGPPGSGKTMLAQRFPGILPPYTFEESVEVSKIQSVAGLLKNDQGLITQRPYRTPHSNVSYAGMVGGGSPIKPGELSLAHHGVLFMDELPQFHLDVLDSLRQPLEDKSISVVRLSGSVRYPAEFLFVGAMNPCPCGYFGDLRRTCMCRPSERINYMKRISGPLLDRIDLHVEISRLSHERFSSREISEPSTVIRERVMRARQKQEKRFGSKTNSQMSSSEMDRFCELSTESEQLLKRAYDKLYFSARGHSKILKIARSIADLAESADIEVIHLAEALQYRVLDRNLYQE